VETALSEDAHLVTAPSPAKDFDVNLGLGLKSNARPETRNKSQTFWNLF
jgi:hypothetical protein